MYENVKYEFLKLRYHLHNMLVLGVQRNDPIIVYTLQNDHQLIFITRQNYAFFLTSIFKTYSPIDFQMCNAVLLTML